MNKFKELGLSEGMLNILGSLNFNEPTDIQIETIPLVLQGKDIIGSSATGSGKTLAFGAGLIDMTKRGEGIQTLILTPTRELAEQVASTLRIFSRNTGLRIRQIYGGVSMSPQINDLKNAEIVVGTPGRLLDHLERRTLNLSKIKYLVLDEADRMLDMGFIRDVERIIRSCSNNRQTLLFSATMPKEISYMAQKYMKNPIHVSSGENVDPSKLYQIYYDVSKDMKFSLIAFLLKREKNGIVMVFCNTRKITDKLAKNLGTNGLHALAIHGGLSQNKRSSVLQAFHSRETLILVCTDVAARGLDIKDVSHVYNYDIPKTSSDYIHRIGRTARAGKNGIAVSFVSSGDHGEFNQILKQMKLNIEKQNLPKFDILKVSSLENDKPFRNKENNRRSGRNSRGNRRQGDFKGRGRGRKENRGRFRGSSNYRKHR